MGRIRLELPSKAREAEAMEYKAEFKENGSEMHGDGGMGKAENYEEWVQQKEDWHNEINVPSELVPSTTYFVIRDDDDRIVGMIDLRHSLNDYLKKSWNGHIGYAIRSTERRKGYATEMLKLALKEYEKMDVDSVIVGCDEKNVGSKKTILRCGGELMDRSVIGGEMHLGFEIKLGDKK
jgi:predicted acetyltransferase